MPREDHTWPIDLHYYQCPKCAEIFADRKRYQYSFGGQYFKELVCPRCVHAFTVYKAERSSIGTVSGEQHPPEVEWI